MSLSLVEKFESIEIGLTDVISVHDEHVCKFHQKQYLDALRIYEEVLKKYQEIYSAYSNNEFGHRDGPISDWDDIRHTQTRIEKAFGEFINSICYHFERRYKFTINRDFKEKYDTTITYHDIVHEIVGQLDGLNFEEKAVRELKEQLLNYYFKVEVVKRKANLKGFMYTEEGFSGNKRFHYSWREKLYCLTANLSHFEFGDIEPTQKYNQLMQELDRNRDDEEFTFKKHPILYDDVKSLTFRKNRKVEIEFLDEGTALKFAREYLGWEEE
ncbi:hypothetical protein [Niallia taxi]|uniref:hypothetical protein n=1 Tax=Niallia taxi TaxID=2499688 RepID=UPI0015F77773|nr:hypothetical protein [Niallia taxi]